jgi:Rieske Fe-S protein
MKTSPEKSPVSGAINERLSTSKDLCTDLGCFVIGPAIGAEVNALIEQTLETQNKLQVAPN